MHIDDLFDNEFYDDDDYDPKDLFLRCDYRFKDIDCAFVALKQFEIYKTNKTGEQKAMLMLIACAMAYYTTKRWIAYPRNPNRYSGMKRYNGSDYNYKKITASVDRLEAKDLFDHELMFPGAHRCKNPKQSSFKATPKLFEALKHLELEFVEHDPIRKRQLFDRETGKICYRKIPGRKYVSKLIPYEEDEITIVYRQEIVKINDFLRTVDLKWPGMEDRWVGGYNHFDCDGVLSSRLSITRVFSRGNFNVYGRCHGFWQNVDKELRPDILLNGETTCEPDYSQCHFNIAYLSKDLAPPLDGYDIADFDKKQVKTAVSMLLNASSEKSANGALVGKFGIGPNDAQAIIDAVKSKHPLISDLFHQDLGVHYMFIESCILVQAMLMLVEERIPFLPIHDGLRVPVSKQDSTVAIMKEAFRVKYPSFTAPIKVK